MSPAARQLIPRTFRHGAPVWITAIVLAVAGAAVAVTTAGDPPESGVQRGESGLIAFTRSAGRTSELLTIDPTTGEVRTLLSGHGPVGSPAWSPDGKDLAFVTRDAAYRGFQVHVLTAATGTITRLLDPSAIDGSPSWSPEGTRIAFSSNREQIGFAVHVMDRDGSGLRTVIPGRAPAWSPDGLTIAFVRLVEGRHAIFVTSPDGSGLQQLTDGSTDDRDPAWSPDGRDIVFSRTGNGGSGLYVIPARGGEPRAITDGMADDRYPSWSPDGGQIVFSRLADGTRDLWLVGPDGQGERRITSDPLFDINPSWQRLPPT
jgi:Tol biopolymer transport system component